MSVEDEVADSQALHAAMKGAGTDDSELINIICKRKRFHLQRVRHHFESEFHEDLISEIKKDCSGHYKDVLIGLLQSDSEYRVKLLEEAFDGLGTHERLLIDVICTGTNQEIANMKHLYRQKHETGVVAHLKKELRGHACDLLVSVLAGGRDDHVIEDKLESDCEAIYKATKGKLGTDEEVLIDIIGNRSREHMVKVGELFQAQHKVSLEICLANECGGDFKDILLALIIPLDEYFSRRLEKAMKGLGTDEHALTRIILLPHGKVLHDVMVHYNEKRSEGALEKDILKEAHGNFGKALVTRIHAAIKW